MIPEDNIRDKDKGLELLPGSYDYSYSNAFNSNAFNSDIILLYIIIEYIIYDYFITNYGSDIAPFKYIYTIY